MFILEPNEITRDLTRKKVTIYDFSDGRVEVRHQGLALPYRTFDRITRVDQCAIVENKRLSEALEMCRTMFAQSVFVLSVGTRMYRVYFRALRVGFIATIAAIGVTRASAQIAPPQTPVEKHLSEQCYKRSDDHLNAPFKYPLRVGAFRNPDTPGVFVYPDQWKGLLRSQKVNLLRDVACWYAGGRMIKKYWYDFGAIDPDSDQAIEVISGTELWPKSGKYK